MLEKHGYYKLRPSMLVKYTPIWPPSVELNCEWVYMGRFSLGLGYRMFDGIIANIKIPITQSIEVGYSFDYTTSKMRFGGSNSHEIVVHFTPCNIDKSYKLETPCPAFD